MATPKLYLETSVVSYLTAEGSRDLILVAHQEVTRAWWASREGFDVYASQFVLDEACAGDTEAAARRLKALEGVPLLDVTAEVIALAERLLADHGLPSKARLDALHVATAAVHGMDYLLSWNCKHIANAMLRSKIESICRAAGFEPPVICTPLELVEE
ncbi:MAG: type II toxin-antitoxin system VapC family toxin [Deltaproteobacteria bacterium]